MLYTKLIFIAFDTPWNLSIFQYFSFGLCNIFSRLKFLNFCLIFDLYSPSKC